MRDTNDIFPPKMASELTDEYYNLFHVELENTISMDEAKKCAITTVGTILFALGELDWDSDGLYEPDMQKHKEYWQAVLNELNKPT